MGLIGLDCFSFGRGSWRTLGACRDDGQYFLKRSDSSAILRYIGQRCADPMGEFIEIGSRTIPFSC